MSRLNQSTQKAKQHSHSGAIKPATLIKPFLKLSVEWQILFALLLLMCVRLVTIIVLVVKQL